MKQEPIGKLCLGCGSSMTDEQLALKKMYDHKLISCCPDRKMVDVYTAPKELSDEEIINLAFAMGFLTKENLINEWSGYTQEFIAVIKAILKKASEK